MTQKMTAILMENLLLENINKSGHGPGHTKKLPVLFFNHYPALTIRKYLISLKSPIFNFLDEIRLNF